MVNSWSLLFDELNMTNKSKYYYDYDRNDPNRKNPFTDGRNADGRFPANHPSQDFWESDGTSLTGNPGTASPDSIVLGGSRLPGGMGDDHITFTTDDPITKTSNSKRKYSEDEIIKELKDYITRTYDQHYSAGDDKIQTLDLIEACGDGEAFCRSNILKYASRYDKKGTARRDIMKILHYAVLLMHFNDKNANRETYPQ